MIRRNTKEAEEKYERNPPYDGNEPIMRALVPKKPAEPAPEVKPATPTVCVNKNTPAILWREGETNLGSFKERPVDIDGVSYRVNLSNPLPKTSRAVFRPGKPYFAIDTTKLPPEAEVIPDKDDPYQFGVKGVSPQGHKNAVIPDSKGTFPN